MATNAAWHAAKALVPPATAVVEAAGSALSNLLRGANAIWQPIGYLDRHMVATEIAGLVGAKAALSLAPVDTSWLEAEAEAKGEGAVRLRIETRDCEDDPYAAELTVALGFELKGEVGVKAIGGEASAKTGLELSVRGELPPTVFDSLDLEQIAGDLFYGLDSTMKVSLTVDAQFGGSLELGSSSLQPKVAYGRKLKIELEQHESISDRFGDLQALLTSGDPQRVAQSLGDVAIRLTIQDRAIAGFGFEAGASYAGYGFGIDELSVTWEEASPVYRQETTIAEAAKALKACLPK